jgi:LPS export ABC transporter protein LptC
MKQAISLSISLGLAVLVWLSMTTNDNDLLQQTSNEDYVEIFMNDFELTAMNENGKPDYILNGSHLKRYANSDDTEVQQPVIHLLQENSQWEIVAEQAIINYKTNTIKLKNNVVMQQQNTEPTVTIRTQFLSIHTKTQIAQTKAFVELTQGDSRLRSNGMIFNNTNGQLELLSKVHGYYSSHDLSSQ